LKLKGAIATDRGLVCNVFGEYHVPYTLPLNIADNYLCNQVLSPLVLWVRLPLMARRTTLC